MLLQHQKARKKMVQQLQNKFVWAQKLGQNG